jgi:hypothetical protein
VLTEATCNAWFTDNYLPVIQGKRMYKVRASQCLVCSGSFDQPVIFATTICRGDADQRRPTPDETLCGQAGQTRGGTDG